jgi:hypothetical protein
MTLAMVDIMLIGMQQAWSTMRTLLLSRNLTCIGRHAEVQVCAAFNLLSTACDQRSSLLSVAFALLNAKDDRGIRRLRSLGAIHRPRSNP